MEYYVYLLSYPEQMGGAVFYVGKGKGQRVHQHERDARQGNSTHNVEKFLAIKSIHDAGYKVVKAIVFRTNSGHEALRREHELIALHGTTITNIQRPLSSLFPSTEERLKRAIERALWLNRQLAEKYPENEREERLREWDRQSIEWLERKISGEEDRYAAR